MAVSPVSPKVTAGASTGAVVGLILSYVSTLSPDAFAFLGKYQGLAFLVVTLAGGAVAAWAKSDPLRTVPAPPVAPVAAPVVPVALSLETTPVTAADPAAVTVTPEYTATPTG
jgi:hypothetical protein